METKDNVTEIEIISDHPCPALETKDFSELSFPKPNYRVSPQITSLALPDLNRPEKKGITFVDIFDLSNKQIKNLAIAFDRK